MGFLDETMNLLGIERGSGGAIMSVKPGAGVVIEGYKKIIELSSERVSVALEDQNIVEILGDGLEIREISYKELTLLGRLRSINFQSGQRNVK